ncbi:MAG: type secretion system contractile sheath protein TssC, partial [Bacteroidetes bacterium]|nr:type secretion system contractile sheath protein TssC [Bacteroidota bacterium]
MAEEQQEQQGQQAAYKERVRVANPAEALTESTTKLAKHGGFDLLEVSIDGVQNLNPEKKARKKIFLTESDKKKEREQLKKTLQMWYDLIAESGSVSEMSEKAQQRSEGADKLLKKNLASSVEETKDLERSYRSMAMFFKNTESDKLKNVTIMNASPDQLKDLDNTRFIDTVSEELKNNYDRLDMRKNYGILVVPGYLGSNKVVEKWAKIAHENKVMMVTDFLHLDGADDVMEMFEEANLTSGDGFKSNVMMACNWLVGRGKFNELGEEEDLYLPPSTALAGKVYQTLMSQVTAGKKHGSMNEVDG